MPRAEPADLLRTSEDGMHGCFDLQPCQFQQRHHDHSAADEIIASGSLDAGAADFDREVPGGDLAMGFAQAALHRRIHLRGVLSAEEFPTIIALHKGRVIHVRAEHPSGFAARAAELICHVQVAEFVLLEFEIRRALQECLDLRAHVIFMKRGRGLLEESLENAGKAVGHGGDRITSFCLVPTALLREGSGRSHCSRLASRSLCGS